MRSSLWVRFLGWTFLVLLAVVIARVALEPSLWPLLLVFLGFLWVYGFALSHSYVLMHDGIGSARR